MPQALPPGGLIRYDPGVTDRSGEIFANGISQAAKSVSDTIDELGKQHKQAKAMRTMAIDGLGMDPEEVNGMDLPTLTGHLQGAALKSSRAAQDLTRQNEQLKLLLGQMHLANERALPTALQNAFPQEDSQPGFDPSSMLNEATQGPPAPSMSNEDAAAMMGSGGGASVPASLPPDFDPSSMMGPPENAAPAGMASPEFTPEIREQMMRNFGSHDYPRRLVGFHAFDPTAMLSEAANDDANPSVPSVASVPDLSPEDRAKMFSYTGSLRMPGREDFDPAPMLAQIAAQPAARSQLAPADLNRMMAQVKKPMDAQARIAAAIRTPGLSADGIKEIMAAIRSGVPPAVTMQPGLHGDRVYGYGNRLIVKNDKETANENPNVEFSEDPVTGARYAKLGKVLSPSGVNPSKRSNTAVDLTTEDGEPTGFISTWDGKRQVITKKPTEVTGKLKPVIDPSTGKAKPGFGMDAAGKVHDFRSVMQKAMGGEEPEAAAPAKPAAEDQKPMSYSDFLKWKASKK